MVKIGWRTDERSVMHAAQSILGYRDQLRGTSRDEGHKGQAEKAAAKRRARAKLAKASKKRNRKGA
jgi:hypothetical protein